MVLVGVDEGFVGVVDGIQACSDWLLGIVGGKCVLYETGVLD